MLRLEKVRSSIESIGILMADSLSRDQEPVTLVSEDLSITVQGFSNQSRLHGVSFSTAYSDSKKSVITLFLDDSNIIENFRVAVFFVQSRMFLESPLRLLSSPALLHVSLPSAQTTGTRSMYKNSRASPISDLFNVICFHC